MLTERQGVAFAKARLPLRSGGVHEFDAVAADGSIVAEVKTAGTMNAGQLHSCTSALYFLSLVEAPRRVLIMTHRAAHDRFVTLMHGKIVPEVEVEYVVLPHDLAAEVARLRQIAADEITPTQ